MLLSGRIAPDPRLACTLSYEFNKINSLGINDVSRDTHLTGFEIRFAVNPRIQLISFYQYNTAASRATLNARFVWEYRPLSFLYLVWNDNRFHQVNPETSLLERNQVRQGLFKATLLWQF